MHSKNALLNRSVTSRVLFKRSHPLSGGLIFLGRCDRKRKLFQRVDAL
jgi:hypothetical protein